jgi:serine/threonine-protein kinase
VSALPGRGSGRWGHLLLTRKLGEGAFGEVYLAHDPWLDHAVAVKLLKTDVAGTTPPSKILHEARKLARVRHPNVVTVHGADRHEGRIGFWMDFVEGQTLADWLEAGRLSAGEATYVGQEVCRALTAVHQAKIVHRDVKAQNVMRAADGGRIILMDFGAGEFIDDPLLLVREGTPLYLAPEVLEGAPASVQSDIYAVGVLLYHLVTRRFPVNGRSLADLTEAHRRHRRTHLSDERADLPDGFIAAVERALDPDPSRRYASAGQMYAALAGQPPTAAMVSSEVPVTAAPARSRARGWAAGLASAVAVVFLTGFVASRVFEVALHIDPAFGASPVDYLVVGMQALPPLVLWGVLGGLVCLPLVGIRLLLPRPWASATTSLRSRLDGFDPAVGAGLILVAGVVGWTLITWAFYPVFAAVIALQEAVPGQSVDLAILGPAGRGANEAHGAYSAYLSFVLALAVWRLFPHLESRAADAGTVRVMRWATTAVALLSVVASSSPRRLVWERFEVVMFENQPSVVLGRNADELLLYAPQRAIGRYQRVARSAPGLEYTGVRRQIFADR